MRGGVGSYGSPSTPSAEITVRMASGSGSFMSLSCGVFGPVRSTRWGEQANRDVWGSVVPRDGRRAAPGRSRLGIRRGRVTARPGCAHCVLVR